MDNKECIKFLNGEISKLEKELEKTDDMGYIKRVGGDIATITNTIMILLKQ